MRPKDGAKDKAPFIIVGDLSLFDDCRGFEFV